MYTFHGTLGTIRPLELLTPRGRVRTLAGSASVLVALATCATAQSICFEGPPTVPSWNAIGQSLAVATGDLDGDGILDLVATNSNTDDVSVLRGLSGGGFAPEVRVAVGDYPRSLALGDLDLDGDLDVVVGNHGSSSVSVLLNLGAGTFAPAVTFGSAPLIRTVSLGDMDGDGDLDLVLAAEATSIQGGGRVVVLKNNGSGTFVSGMSQTLLGSFWISATVGDIDGDGDLDIVATDSQRCQLLTYTNPGNGAMLPPQALTFGNGYPTSIAVGDFDADGDVDAAIASASSRDVAVFLNDGTGAYTRTSVLLVGAEPASVVAFDLDSDGDLDLTTTAQDSVVLWLGNGDGTFGARDDFGLASTSVTSIAPGDFDRDGDVDLAVTLLSERVIAVLRNCETSGTTFCAGDGSATACPCGNASALGSGDGCLNTLGLGASLRGSGAASLANDTLVLAGTQMPNAAALYFQGTARANAGLGSVFGDGLRCAGATNVRLGTKINSGGASQYPAGGDFAVSVTGAITTAGTRTYQVWYRNAATFCTASTFNLSNGWEIAWAP